MKIFISQIKSILKTSGKYIRSHTYLKKDNIIIYKQVENENCIKFLSNDETELLVFSLNESNNFCWNIYLYKQNGFGRFGISDFQLINLLKSNEEIQNFLKVNECSNKLATLLMDCI